MGIFYVVPPEEAVLCNASSKINYHSDRYGTVAAIVITGIIGNMFAEGICKLCKIEHPIAKGLAIGTASHAMGTAKAMEIGEIEGAMSSLSIAVAGLMTVVGASIFYHLY